jgi:hypothetical protein
VHPDESVSRESGTFVRTDDVVTGVSWRTRREEKERRLARAAKLARGRVLPTGEIVPALEALVAPGDRVVLEGDNQKQADFLSRSLAAVDPAKIHNLHMLISSISRPEQLDLFERGIAEKVDFAYAGPQSLRVAQLLADGKLRVGAIHTWSCTRACSSTSSRPWRWWPPRQPTPRATSTPARTPRKHRRSSRRPPSATAS